MDATEHTRQDASAERTPLAVPSPAAPMTWDAWGDGSAPAALPAGARILIRTLLPGRAHPVRRRPRGEVRLSASQLSDADVSALTAALGATEPGAGRADRNADDARSPAPSPSVTRADEVRLLHLGGKSTLDLLSRRADGVQDAPDGVAFPASHDQVAALLRVCDERGIAVVPFGGGTSVVGGVAPERGRHTRVVAVDLSRTAALWELDAASLLATFGAGTTGPQAEELLGARGYTLGHFPQSFAFASLGGYAATRSSGQASRGFGRFDDLVHGLRVATPSGDLDLGRAPASAAGPDLRELFLGSEGAFGILTEVTVRIRPRASQTRYGAWTFPAFADGAEALRTLTQRGIRPTVLRLSDEQETRVNAAMGGHVTRMRGCLAVATFEGEDAAAAEAATAQVFAAHGGRSRGEDPARSWERGRFGAPSLRDALLDAGVLAETLETATTWAGLATLKSAVTAALTKSLSDDDAAPVVLCHISHVYPAGASLYFTVIAALTAEPAQQWTRAKDAASRAIIAAGGTITHHHAVGRDHRPYLEAEIGPLGTALLQAVKRTLDPRGIMNPGALVEPERR